MRPFQSTAASLAMLAAALVSGLVGSLASGLASAQTPLTSTSVEDLLRSLGGPGKKSFQRTQPPQADTNVCPGQPGVPAGTAAGAGKRNLEVVAYAGDTTAGVNLNVQFAYGSDKLTDADRALLDTLASALKHPDLAAERFAVAGHTDLSGDARINLELSCARALAVRRYLVGKGVADRRLSAYGFGSTRLLVDNSPSDSIHRRVEVRKAPE